MRFSQCYNPRFTVLTYDHGMWEPMASRFTVKSQGGSAVVLEVWLALYTSILVSLLS